MHGGGRIPDFQYPFCCAGFSRWYRNSDCRPARKRAHRRGGHPKNRSRYDRGGRPFRFRLCGSDSADLNPTPLAGLPSSGAIFWVSANDSGEKLIAGQNGSSPYAVFVSPDGQLTPVADLPAGTVYSAISIIVEMGSSGEQLHLSLCGFIAPNGTAIRIPGLPTAPGIIYNVALIQAGTGFIAGYSAGEPYGAFVSLDENFKVTEGLPEVWIS